MREFERAVGDATLLARCDARLATQAEWLLRTMAKVLDATPFREGMTIQIGWTRFSLRTQAGRVVVCEPAFHGNPFAQSNQDVTLSLAILGAHDDMIQVLGIEPEAISFHHGIRIWRDCLSQPRVVMERRSGAGGGGGDKDESGWTIGVEGIEVAEGDERIEWIRATELLRVRRALLLPLIAPVGWTATWDGDAITSMKDRKREERWTPKAAEVLRENRERLEWAWRHPTGRSIPPS